MLRLAVLPPCWAYWAMPCHCKNSPPLPCKALAKPQAQRLRLPRAGTAPPFWARGWQPCPLRLQSCCHGVGRHPRSAGCCHRSCAVQALSWQKQHAWTATHWNLQSQVTKRNAGPARSVLQPHGRAQWAPPCLQQRHWQRLCRGRAKVRVHLLPMLLRGRARALSRALHLLCLRRALQKLLPCPHGWKVRQGWRRHCAVRWTPKPCLPLRLPHWPRQPCCQVATALRMAALRAKAQGRALSCTSLQRRQKMRRPCRAATPVHHCQRTPPPPMRSPNRWRTGPRTIYKMRN